METFTIFAVYDGNHARIAIKVNARDATQAEKVARKKAQSDIIIAAVVRGDIATER